MSGLLKELRELFDRSKDESFLDTARTLTQPSTISREVASKTIASLDLTQVIRDLGTSAAQEVANELETMGLRPADYADLPDLPEGVALLIMQAIRKTPTEFAAAFLTQLKLRG